uniref:thiamine pyrophosphate-dependent dehydrogenase E1 component subunit alpha n=1 Tax=Cyanobium sp. TaxID=2164130 RepID=UPI004048B231
MSDNLKSLVDLYEVMYRIRYAEKLIIRHYPGDEMKTPMHMSMGSEAIAAGVCGCLDEADIVFGTYRTHALYIAKTKETYHFFAELLGRKDGVASGRSGSMHLHSVDKGYLVSSGIVGGTLSLGVGAGLAAKMDSSGRTVAVFFGDGAADTGTFWESINFAALMNLPVLFVLENNGLAVNSPPQKRYGHKGVYEVLQNYKIVTRRDDTNDVEQIHKTSMECLDIIRCGGGPAFIQVDYCRILDHIGIEPCAHSPKDVAIENDPVERARKLLLAFCGEKKVIRLEEQIQSQVQKDLESAFHSEFAEPLICMENIV